MQDWEHQQEEDRLLTERLLILIRNILHVPPDTSAEKVVDTILFVYMSLDLASISLSTKCSCVVIENGR